MIYAVINFLAVCQATDMPEGMPKGTTMKVSKDKDGNETKTFASSMSLDDDETCKTKDTKWVDFSKPQTQDYCPESQPEGNSECSLEKGKKTYCDYDCKKACEGCSNEMEYCQVSAYCVEDPKDSKKGFWMSMSASMPAPTSCVKEEETKSVDIEKVAQDAEDELLKENEDTCMAIDPNASWTSQPNPKEQEDYCPELEPIGPDAPECKLPEGEGCAYNCTRACEGCSNDTHTICPQFYQCAEDPADSSKKFWMPASMGLPYLESCVRAEDEATTKAPELGAEDLDHESISDTHDLDTFEELENKLYDDDVYNRYFEVAMGPCYIHDSTGEMSEKDYRAKYVKTIDSRFGPGNCHHDCATPEDEKMICYGFRDNGNGRCELYLKPASTFQVSEIDNAEEFAGQYCYIKGVNCGGHFAINCEHCPPNDSTEPETHCNGQCVYDYVVDAEKKEVLGTCVGKTDDYTVDCGAHRATSCEACVTRYTFVCPLQERYCHGECEENGCGISCPEAEMEKAKWMAETNEMDKKLMEKVDEKMEEAKEMESEEEPEMMIDEPEEPEMIDEPEEANEDDAARGTKGNGFTGTDFDAAFAQLEDMN